ncbi:W protein [Ovine lentivirus]|uniref:Putative uncharacterized protein W n=1 Tax=Ovine maedi visna related virus (strain South Africa) TaxID=11664 RepID=VPW_OMVVS|nr:W protein [Ovine lentivirus]P19510.1 RecName: Full=Putative uncharacterized protein W [Ovine lentivirus (strain SA-OMVV)]pir/D46335/ W protein - Maedi/Visna virus (strain SA-OMVV) [Visna-maedi virus]AAA46781.1 W protein [Ovine lentivirus]AAA66814.1 W protein [Ovine lentivirus]
MHTGRNSEAHRAKELATLSIIAYSKKPCISDNAALESKESNSAKVPMVRDRRVIRYLGLYRIAGTWNQYIINGGSTKKKARRQQRS